MKSTSYARRFGTVKGMRVAVRGFSIIELMVGVTIALIVSLAIFAVLQASESRKRVTTSVNDINQSGAYLAYVLDRAIRSAGSGFATQYDTLDRLADVEGCRLSVTRAGAAVLPRATNFPAPFAAMPRTPVLAPLIIDPGIGGAPDVLTVMSGSQGRSEAGARVIGPTGTGVGVSNTLGFNPSDLLVFGHAASGAPCQVSQVAGAAAFTPLVPPTAAAVNQDLPLDGPYLNAGGTASLTGDLALGIGNATDNPPQFKMYGVQDRQLVSFDLLNIDGLDVPQPVADSVVTMHAIYGVDTNDLDNVKTIGGWVAPTGNWAPAILRNGSAESSARLRNIVAVRLALVLRTADFERDRNVPLDTEYETVFDLYADLPAGSPALTLTYVDGQAQRFRYRLIETTIPLRNNLQL